MPDEHRRSAVRTAVVWDAVHDLLAARAEATGRSVLDVVDLGGGTGVSAVRVAALGHRVLVVDPSPDALASLARRAADEDVADRITGVQGDTGDLLDHAAEASADVVLCHGVLEVVDDPAQALATIARVLRPDGVLSVLVAGRFAAVLARALAGHFGPAHELLGMAATGSGWDVRRHGPRRWTRDEITGLLDAAGFETHAVHAVRVFADLVPSALVVTEPGASEELLALEREVAAMPEFTAVAAQLHVLAGHR